MLNLHAGPRPFGTFCGHSLTAVLLLPLLVPLGVKLEQAWPWFGTLRVQVLLNAETN